MHSKHSKFCPDTSSFVIYWWANCVKTRLKKVPLILQLIAIDPQFSFSCYKIKQKFTFVQINFILIIHFQNEPIFLVVHLIKIGKHDWKQKFVMAEQILWSKTNRLQLKFSPEYSGSLWKSENFTSIKHSQKQNQNKKVIQRFETFLKNHPSNR